MLFHQIIHRIDVIGQIFAAHVPINSGAPIAPITRAAAIIDIQHDKTLSIKR